MSAVTLVLQARTNSSRLPGKMLLPVGGMPLAVLAARRAANTGLSVLIVTSREPSDDALCEILREREIPFFRGSLNDTLARFADALSGLPEDQLIVRLTGDNVLPDGPLIEELLEAYRKNSAEYLRCGGPDSGLPYGISAEITLLRHINEANRLTRSAYDREHVTPWIIRAQGDKTFDGYRQLGMSHYRCTVDTFDDYQLVLKLFKGVTDPVNASLAHLIEKLKSLPEAPTITHAADKLVLGSAQLGMDYGIANLQGKPSQEEADKIVHMAVRNGVQWIDTARAYGNSEQVLGKALRQGWHSQVGVITKLSTLEDCPEKSVKSVVDAFVDRSLYQSCHELEQPSLEVLMLHRANHLDDWCGCVWQRLLEHRDQGLVKHLGVSVQTPDELITALAFPEIHIVQLPFNILDGRWDKAINTIKQIKSQRQLVVHVRSALLQGLLPSRSPKLWHKAHCPDYVPVQKWLQKWASKCSSGDVAGLCLNYVIAQPWVDGVVVGVETAAQLETNLRFLDETRLTDSQLRQIQGSRPTVSNQTLNPACWN